MKRGEIRADLDPDTVLDLLYGPLYLRLLLKHAPLDENFVNTVFEVVSPVLSARSTGQQLPFRSVTKLAGLTTKSSAVYVGTLAKIR
jgi:hypothetical protein